MKNSFFLKAFLGAALVLSVAAAGQAVAADVTTMRDTVATTMS